MTTPHKDIRLPSKSISMKRKDVIDNIEGSRLKKQFLEAFLLQSAFIESLLKKLIQDDFFANITFKVMQEELKKGSNFQPPKQVNYWNEKLMRQNLYEIIEYLAKIDVITDVLKKQLHVYREKRNIVLHDLVGTMTRLEFEKELEGLVSTGQEILNNAAMIKASESVQKNEDFSEAFASNDQQKIKDVLERYTKKPVPGI